MIINNILQGVAGAYLRNVNQTTSQAKKNESGGAQPGKDELVLSSNVRNFSSSLQTIRSTAETVREDKVAFFKQQIGNGTYQINAEGIAEKIMSMRY